MVTNNEDKVVAFEYVLYNLINWQKESNCLNGENNLSTLKAIKLLFFVSAVNAKSGNSNYLIKNVFNDFVAMPYGHVESGIYDEIRRRKGVLNYYTINNTKSVPAPEKNVSELESKLSSQTVNEIKASISALKKHNPNLICLSAFELVDLSHFWYSWRNIYAKAKYQNVGSMKIDSEVIINEDKIFSLQML